MQKMMTAVLDTEVGSRLLKENRLRHAGAIYTIPVKTTRLQPAVRTQLKIKGVIRLNVHLEQRIPENFFLVITNPAINIILRTAYMDEYIEKSNSKKTL